MRRFVAAVFILIAVVALGGGIAWSVFGERVVSRLDQYRTVEESSVPVRSIRYMGDGNGGVLWMDIGQRDLVLFNLTPADAGVGAPHVGTTAKGELAISSGGKVFVCGGIPTDGPLALTIPPDDRANLTGKRSLISWPTWFEDAAAKKNAQRKRNWYYEFAWTHPSGAALRITWRWQQPCLNGSWVSASTDNARLSAVAIDVR